MPWAQEVPGSNPGAPTKQNKPFCCNDAYWRSPRPCCGVLNVEGFEGFRSYKIDYNFDYSTMEES